MLKINIKREKKIFKMMFNDYFSMRKKIEGTFPDDEVTAYIRKDILETMKYCDENFGYDYDKLKTYMQDLILKKDDYIHFEACHMLLLTNNQTQYYGPETRLQTYVIMNKLGFPFSTKMTLDYMMCFETGYEYLEELLYLTDQELDDIYNDYRDKLLSLRENENYKLIKGGIKHGKH